MCVYKCFSFNKKNKMQKYLNNFENGKDPKLVHDL